MKSLLIIGGTHPTAVGNSLHRAALAIPGLSTSYVDVGQAFQCPRLVRALFWRLMEKRPPRLTKFNRTVLDECRKHRPEFLICAGNMPLTAATVQTIRELGCRTAVYLTDDPWNKAHRTHRFLDSLGQYDLRLTPRKSILPDLEKVVKSGNVYLPFGYEPHYFHLTTPIEDPSPHQTCDVFFAGGADKDRIQPMQALLHAKINLHLYGDLWSRWTATASAFRGYAKPENLAQLIAQASVCLCMVRRANRDEQCMRTYELPAAGACMVVEDTGEHRELFGADDYAVRYFKNNTELVEQTKSLLSSPHDRLRLRTAAHQLITSGGHTYSDRLQTIIHLLSALKG